MLKAAWESHSEDPGQPCVYINDGRISFVHDESGIMVCLSEPIMQ